MAMIHVSVLATPEAGSSLLGAVELLSTVGLEAQSGLSARSFKRRFKQATGLTPLAYAQQLRIDRAKGLLEKSELAVDLVSWKIGYEDVAFFSQLFKRITGLTPAVYRRKFRIPFATGR